MENNKQTSETKKIPGWKDVSITTDLPTKNLIEFLNVLNQRLATVEDNTFIREPDGSMLSITKHYEKQSEADLAEAKAKAKAAAEAPEAKVATE